MNDELNSIPNVGVSLSRLQKIVADNAVFFGRHLSPCEVIEVERKKEGAQFPVYTVRFEDGAEHDGVLQSGLRCDNSTASDLAIGKCALRFITTADVCAFVVRVQTWKTKTSYVEHLRTSFPRDVGKATHFVSHAWKYSFLDLVLCVQEFFKSNAPELPRPFVWIDVLALVQHVSLPTLSPPAAVGGEKRRHSLIVREKCKDSHHYYARIFHNAIKGFGHTLLVLQPWDAPTPLARSWCIWEFYGTLKHQVKLDILLSKSEEVRFVNALRQDYKQIMDSMSKIEVERAEAQHPKDKEMIDSAIVADIGFDQVNEVIFEQYRAWIYSAAKRATKVAGATADARLFHQTALLFSHDQARHEEALILFQRALCIYQIANTSESQLEALRCSQDMATLYQTLGRLSEAGDILEECLLSIETRYGKDHPHTISILVCLAKQGLEQGDFEAAIKRIETAERVIRLDKEEGKAWCARLCEALAIKSKLYKKHTKYEEALAASVEVACLQKLYLGEKHPERAMNLNAHAEILKKMDKLEECIPLYEEALKIYQRGYGNRHPELCQVLSHLGTVHFKIGDGDKALCYFRAAKAGHIDLFGRVAHAKLARILYNEANVHQSRKEWEKALELHKVALSMRKKVLGENHPDVADSLDKVGHIVLSGYECLSLNEVQALTSAKEMLQRAHAIRLESLGERHRKTASAQKGASSCAARLAQKAKDFIHEAQVGGEGLL